MRSILLLLIILLVSLYGINGQENTEQTQQVDTNEIVNKVVSLLKDSDIINNLKVSIDNINNMKANVNDLKVVNDVLTNLKSDVSKVNDLIKKVEDLNNIKSNVENLKSNVEKLSASNKDVSVNLNSFNQKLNELKENIRLLTENQKQDRETISKLSSAANSGVNMAEYFDSLYKSAKLSATQFAADFKADEIPNHLKSFATNSKDILLDFAEDSVENGKRYFKLAEESYYKEMIPLFNSYVAQLETVLKPHIAEHSRVVAFYSLLSVLCIVVFFAIVVALNIFASILSLLFCCGKKKVVATVKSNKIKAI